MESSEEELQALLSRLRLERFAEEVKTLGVESRADLAYVEDADLEKLGLPLVPRRKLLEAAGGQWRKAPAPAAATAPSLPSSPATAPALPPAPAAEPEDVNVPTRDEEEPEGEELTGLAKEEMEQLLRDLRNIREDFATVNCLDLSSRSRLGNLPARVALRTMGLLGTGNSFFMEGIKKPAAALRARSENAKIKGMEPYQDWVKLLEGFVAANKLSDRTKEALERLSRHQALKVMGFTSELRFLAGPVYRGEAELEVRTRLWAVQSDVPMVPVLPRGKGDEAKSRSPRRATRVIAAPSSVLDEFPHWKKHVEAFIEANNVDDRAAELLRDATPMAALHTIGLLGVDNTFLLRGVRQPGAVVANRLRKVPPGGGAREAFAQLNKLMEDFITVNRLGAEACERFRGLPREQALRVMGFSSQATDWSRTDRQGEPTGRFGEPTGATSS
ncbi:unnamed protein product [Durusdinium trenchii]|uniref:SAM domain-containing protein n=1 Tax=Durusdinium trenchii TaxID=1381693 RepID=A0ABP0Q1L9_9DINO